MPVIKPVIRWIGELKLSVFVGRATRLRNKLETTESQILDHLRKHTPKCKNNRRTKHSSSSPPIFSRNKKHQLDKCNQ